MPLRILLWPLKVVESSKKFIVMSASTSSPFVAVVCFTAATGGQNVIKCTLRRILYLISGGCSATQFLMS